ncbi:hypothetical protein ACSFBX_22285 [Variovorax sp. RB2P76]|uniref:hypothetical protein n=1 Tax=Variovorax sp. RB2P76 TaxID=3443736 RepID=UPI003F45F786
MDKKEPLNVKSEKGRELVVEIDGKDKTFYLNPIRTMWLDLEVATLFVGASSHVSIDYETLAIESTDAYRLEPPKSRISGIATLGRSSIAVIGNRKTRSNTLRVSFHEYDYEKDAESKKAEGLPTAKTAHIFYSEHDWEIGNKDGWELTLYVEKPLLAQIHEAIVAKRAKAINLGIRLSRIYSDDDWAPPSAHPDWFALPEGSGAGSNPVGHLENCHIELEQVDLRTLQNDYVEDEQDAEVKPVPADPSVIALGKLSENIEAMRTTIKWVGGLLFGALVLMLFK